MYINGTKLHFGATEIKSKANTPTWHDGPCLLRMRFFSERLAFFRYANDFQQFSFVSRVRIEVLGIVN